MLTRKIILIGSIAITAVILSGCIFQKKNTVSNNNINNAKEVVVQDLKNGFSVEIPSGWSVISTLKDATNTVKFGSPVQVTDLKPVNNQEEIYGPTIILSTFIIDERLSAKDVVNLINNDKIADKIMNGTDKCYSNGEETTVAGMNAYAYTYDTTDFNICNIATEPGISKTIVIKNAGNQDTLMLTLVARNKDELNTLLPDFQKVVDSVKYQ